MTTKSSLTRSQLLIGVPIILIVFGALILGIVWWADMGAKRRSAAGQPQITRAEPQTWWNSRHRKKQGFRISYNFVTAAGQNILSVEDQNTSYTPDTQFRVCYDPNNPSDNSLHTPNGKPCGKGLLF